MFEGANVTEFLEHYKDLCLDYRVLDEDRLTVTGNKFSRNSLIFAFLRRVPFFPSTTPQYISIQRIPLGT
jgi:hypothetical protein